MTRSEVKRVLVSKGYAYTCMDEGAGRIYANSKGVEVLLYDNKVKSELQPHALPFFAPLATLEPYLDGNKTAFIP